MYFAQTDVINGLLSEADGVASVRNLSVGVTEYEVSSVSALGRVVGIQEGSLCIDVDMDVHSRTSLSSVGHIFRNAEGHIPDTPENRKLLEDVANKAENFRGIDKYGNEWYTEILEDGREVWVESRNGNIFEGGINEMPKPWNPDTGLKKQ